MLRTSVAPRPWNGPRQPFCRSEATMLPDTVVNAAARLALLQAVLQAVQQTDAERALPPAMCRFCCFMQQPCSQGCHSSVCVAGPGPRFGANTHAQDIDSDAECCLVQLRIYAPLYACRLTSRCSSHLSSMHMQHCQKYSLRWFYCPTTSNRAACKRPDQLSAHPWELEAGRRTLVGGVRLAADDLVLGLRLVEVDRPLCECR